MRAPNRRELVLLDAVMQCGSFALGRSFKTDRPELAWTYGHSPFGCDVRRRVCDVALMIYRHAAGERPR